MLGPVYFFDQTSVDRAAAADCQFNDVPLFFTVTAVIFIGGLQTASQQFFIDRLAAAQLGGNKGYD